ncbi:MAG: PstS family phosphate ABC transporter substrate-binding protein [Chloroflexi bacterium]|nr:PstS family phosphate ABC transporter substrate-binding protein [Chloroflexota bacterium]
MIRALGAGVLGAGAAGVLAACGEPEVVTKESEKVATKEVDVEKIVTVPAPASPMTGMILADGSSTVGPVTQAVAEEFRSQFPEVRVPVGVSGSGAGFKKFCAGETDITNASRPIKASEIETCQSNGIDFVEVPVAFDGLAVLANPANDFVDCLTVDELQKIWEPAAEDTVTSWAQVRDGFPDEPLILYGPGVDSGTYDYFTDAIVGEEGASRGDFTPSEDDNVLVQGIAGDRSATGFFGLAYYAANQDKLKLVSVDGGEGCVAPTAETVNTGTYQPLSRPLFIYISAPAAERPEVQTFIEFYMKNAGTLAADVGYVELPPNIYDLALKRFNDRITGSIFEGEGSKVGVSLEDLLS